MKRKQKFPVKQGIFCLRTESGKTRVVGQDMREVKVVRWEEEDIKHPDISTIQMNNYEY